MADDKGQRAEGIWQRAADKRQRTEGRGEGRCQRAEDKARIEGKGHRTKDKNCEGQRATGRRQRVDGRGQRVKGRWQKANGRG